MNPTDQPKKAKKVAPPVDIEQHNRDLKEAPTETPKEVTPMAVLLSTNEVAERLETTPRELRKFLRSDQSGVEGVGQGRRYELPETQVSALKKRFETWKAAAAEARRQREVEVPPEATEEELDEIIEELEAEEPELSFPVAPPEGATRDELYAIAQDLDIAGRSTMTKAQLLEAILSRTEG